MDMAPDLAQSALNKAREEATQLVGKLKITVK
jgi:hypothetical protein